MKNEQKDRLEETNRKIMWETFSQIINRKNGRKRMLDRQKS